jgi:hypothetical protein
MLKLMWQIYRPVWPVALRVDPLIPVAVWRGSRFDGDITGKRILSGRLAKII